MKRVMSIKGRRSTTMSGALFVAAIFLAATPIALAHDTRWAWTESKAEQIVLREATVRLPRLERASLEGELRTRTAYYRALEAAAAGEESVYAVTYHDLAHRYRRALGKVQSGLEVDGAECRGSGQAARRNRFKHFRCAVTSETLEIPSAAIVASENGELPAVVEGESRKLGPFQAQLHVRPTGKSRIAYRQIG
jgi:hypothetical protein